MKIKLIKYSFIIFLINFFININVAQSDNDENYEKFSEGVKAVKEKEYTIAADLFEPLAINGDIDAQYNLSILIRNGLGRPQNFGLSLKWAWLSYTGGFEKAKTVLIDKLLTFVPEENLEEIRNEVLNYILKSINDGNRGSLNQIGKYFLEVVEIPNYEKAYVFYSISVAFGDTEIKDIRDKVLDNINNENIMNIQKITNDFFEILREGDNISLKQLDW